MSGSSRGNGRAAQRMSLLGAAFAVTAVTALAVSAEAGAQAATTTRSIASTNAASAASAANAPGSQRVRHIVAPGTALFASDITQAPTWSAAATRIGADTVSCTTPAVAMYHVDALAQLRRWSFGSPLDGTPGWTQQMIGTGWSGLNVISGGNGVIYTIDQSGDMRWYSDGNYTGGAAAWNPASGTVIGSGWNEYTTVVSGGDGVFYAVDSAGNLYWYRDLAMNGTTDWAPNSGTMIGSGWNTPILLAAGGSGVLFSVTPAGTLTWFRHLDPTGGSATWADGGIGQPIGSGWAGFTGLASMGGGVLMARDQAGSVWWYRDTDPLGGSFSWADGGSGTAEGTGWSNAQLVPDIDGCTAS